MLSHEDVWHAIDRLAEKQGLTPSALARRAGLDPTAFNKSKRISKGGKPRWPTTESLSKILSATGCTLFQFVALVHEPADSPSTRSMPTLLVTRAGQARHFTDDGLPIGEAWADKPMPAVAHDNAFALEVSGDTLAPAARDGDRLIIAPDAKVRRGNRVVVRTRDAQLLIGILRRLSASRIEVAPLSMPENPVRLEPQHVQWMARIVCVTL
jgi:phage repressor protein C with HTH and peptisase S24 domain